MAFAGCLQFPLKIICVLNYEQDSTRTCVVNSPWWNFSLVKNLVKYLRSILGFLAENLTKFLTKMRSAKWMIADTEYFYFNQPQTTIISLFPVE